MKYVKEFFIGFIQGIFFGFGGSVVILLLPHILKQKRDRTIQTINNYNVEDHRTIQFIQNHFPEPQEVNQRVIAGSSRISGESDFS